MQFAPWSVDLIARLLDSVHCKSVIKLKSILANDSRRVSAFFLSCSFSRRCFSGILQLEQQYTQAHYEQLEINQLALRTFVSVLLCCPFLTGKSTIRKLDCHTQTESQVFDLLDLDDLSPCSSNSCSISTSKKDHALSRPDPTKPSNCKVEVQFITFANLVVVSM